MKDQMICYNYYVTEKQQEELRTAQELLNHLLTRAKEFHEILTSFKARRYIHICIY